MLECPSLSRNLEVHQLLADSSALVVQSWDTVNSIHRERVSISLISDSQLERSVDVALLLVATDVDVELAGTLVGESVDEPWVGVEVEDDGSVVREDGLPFDVGHAVGMVNLRDELEEIDDVDETDLE